MRAELEQLTRTRKNHIIDYNESNATKPGTSPNTVFTHRQTSCLGPGRTVEEAYAGTHPHHLTASRPDLTVLKVVGRREYIERYMKPHKGR
jgi:hypothetical protein